MAEQIIFGKISKKINSTSSAMTNVLTTNVLLKKNTSIVSPVMEIKADFATLRACNYAKYAGFCYYIDNVISKNNSICIVSMHRDPLASFKSAILGTKGYVNFGPKTKWNKYVEDPRMTPNVEYNDQKFNVTAFDDILDFDAGAVVMTLVSYQENGSENGVFRICGSYGSFKQFLADAATDIFGSQSFQSGFEKLMGKVVGAGEAFSYIKNAIWVPIKLSVLQDTQFTGSVGPYTIQGTWYNVKYWTGCYSSAVQDLNMSFPANCNTYPWLRSPNYTNITLTSAGGIKNIDTSNFINKEGIISPPVIKVKMFISPSDGTMMLVSRLGNEIIDVSYCDMSINLLEKMESVRSAAGLGIPAGIKVGTTAVAAMASGGSSLASMANGAGEALWDNGYLAQGKRLGELSESMNTNAQIGTVMSQIGSGVGGMMKAACMNSGGKSMSTPQNLSSLYINLDDGNTKFPLTVRMINWEPTLIQNGTYEDYCGDYGYPVFDYLTLSTCSGSYVECAGFSVSGAASATTQEISTINSMVNAGIYLH